MKRFIDRSLAAYFLAHPVCRFLLLYTVDTEVYTVLCPQMERILYVLGLHQVVHTRTIDYTIGLARATGRQHLNTRWNVFSSVNVRRCCMLAGSVYSCLSTFRI